MLPTNFIVRLNGTVYHRVEQTQSYSLRSCTFADIGHDLSPKLPGRDLADSKLPTDLAKRVILKSEPDDRLTAQVGDETLGTATASQWLLPTVFEPTRPLIATQFERDLIQIGIRPARRLASDVVKLGFQAFPLL